MIKTISKKQFLEEHNKLSPPNFQATFTMLSNFQKEKKPELKDDGWSMDKLRIPFITWMINLSRKRNKDGTDESGYKNYPETKLKS